jgi:hypothetical protein
MDNQEEVWKDIPNYEGYYQISNLGRVISLTRIVLDKNGVAKNIKSKAIKSTLNKYNGYLTIAPCVNSKNKQLYVHRLVLSAFTNNPFNKKFVNHKNGIKTDNRLENLEWVTPSENSIHAVEIGLSKTKGGSNPMAKLTQEHILDIRKRFADGISAYKIAKDLGFISNSAIRLIVLRKRWKHI